eukprot:TRINITY_DN111_c1_g1_i1.p1 TRINITY_DN111_c1_g1~~TRINITY_DN111_c1_g1_i1.p1  ORF type:complete len:223 (+),score=32.15 TRINITY_DN111_c1_g1_i1:91-669(+)
MARCALIALLVSPLACDALKATAAEFRRFEGADCKGDFSVLSTDKMDECTPYLIPAPASIFVNQTNDSIYTSFHFQGETDCSGVGTKLGDWTVGECQNFGDYSQLRVWVTAPPPPVSACSVKGACGWAYQSCCIASAATGNPCTCHLHNGTGKAGSRDCGKCGKAFVGCCSAFELTGHGCGCDVMDQPPLVV